MNRSHGSWGFFFSLNPHVINPFLAGGKRHVLIWVLCFLKLFIIIPNCLNWKPKSLFILRCYHSTLNFFHSPKPLTRLPLWLKLLSPLEHSLRHHISLWKCVKEFWVGHRNALNSILQASPELVLLECTVHKQFFTVHSVNTFRGSFTNNRLTNITETALQLKDVSQHQWRIAWPLHCAQLQDHNKKCEAALFNLLSHRNPQTSLGGVKSIALHSVLFRFAQSVDVAQSVRPGISGEQESLRSKLRVVSALTAVRLVDHTWGEE